MTTRDNPTAPLQKSGHCCFLQAGDEWYVTQICARPLTERGYCVLGRETAIQPIEWTEDGWPRLRNHTIMPDLVVPAPRMSQGVVQRLDHSERVEFAPDRPLPPSFKTLRCGLDAEGDYSLTARPGCASARTPRACASRPRTRASVRPVPAVWTDVLKTIDEIGTTYERPL